MATAVTPPPPRTTRRQRKQDQTADHLSATAYRLFEAHGYDAVSMEQVADVADVAKATLYKYFPVKEALIAHRFRLDIAAGMSARAQALIAHLARLNAGRFTRIDIDFDSGLTEWVESLGLLRVDAATTMVRGAPLAPAADARLYAIVTQALG